MTFGANVNLVRYEEADEVGVITGVFAGWGGTSVSHLKTQILQL